VADQAPTSILAVEGATQARTFLIADVRGYTRFTLEQGDEAAAKLASRFAELASEVVARREGQVIELRGDEALAVFTSARQALWASIDLQDRFISESRESSFPFNVGIGLDSGEAIPVRWWHRQ
jgi:class 3 adenylate cyclase